MSRGLGRIEQGMIGVIKNAGLPMSYADIADALIRASGINATEGQRLNASRERSFRRALRNLVKRGVLIELEGDKRSQRYFFHPDDVRGKLREQLNGNWDAAIALIISTLRRIRPEGEIAATDVKVLARGILDAASHEI
jgi:hypothetical protein